MPRAEQITAADAQHGEGPVWSPSWGGLRWVDMLAGDILHLEPGTGAVSRWSVGTVAAAFRPRRSGGAVIATEREFALCDEMGGPLTGLGEVFRDGTVRFNDGATDPAGNFLCGTMACDEAPGRGTLYRLGADRHVEVVLRGVTISNGLAWTADSSRAYYNDTPTGRVDVFDSDPSGKLDNRRLFVAVDGDAGAPDGLTVDGDGGVWVALWGGGVVHRYSASGALDEVVEVAAKNVTACTFGGEHLDELFITTSRNDDEEHPGAGALFRYLPAVSGLPALPFAG